MTNSWFSRGWSILYCVLWERESQNQDCGWYTKPRVERISYILQKKYEETIENSGSFIHKPVLMTFVYCWSFIRAQEWHLDIILTPSLKQAHTYTHTTTSLEYSINVKTHIVFYPCFMENLIRYKNIRQHCTIDSSIQNMPRMRTLTDRGLTH